MKSNIKNNAYFVSSLKISIAVLVGAISLPHGMGQAIYEIGFETSQNYTTTGGSQSNGNLSGQGGDGGSLPNWSTGGSTELKIVTSSSGTTTLLPPEGNQMLQGQYGTGSTTGLQNFLTPENAIKESFNFSFKLAVNAESVGNAAFSMYVSGQQANNGFYIGLSRFGTGTELDPYVYGFIARQSLPGQTSFYTRLGTDTFSLNEFHTFDLTLDWDTLTFGGTVSNAGGVVTTFSDVAIWNRDGNVHDNGFSRLGFQINQIGNSPYFLIDDIRISQIPEPSALVMTLLGAGAVFYRQRRSAGLFSS